MYHTVYSNFGTLRLTFPFKPGSSFHINTFAKFIFTLGNRNKNSGTLSDSSEVRGRNSLNPEELNSDYVKYFKFKKDRMSSFKQGYIKRVKLKGPTYNNYAKFKLRKFT